MLGEAQTMIAGAKPLVPDEDHIRPAAPSRAENDVAFTIENTHYIILSQKSQIGHDILEYLTAILDELRIQSMH